MSEEITRAWKNTTVTELAQENARLRTIVATFSDRDNLIELAKRHLREKHTILWQDFLLEEDKIDNKGVTQPRGLTKAATFLANEVIALMALTETQ